MNWDDLYSGLKVFANRAAIKINQSADIATLQVKLSMAERKLEETFAILGKAAYSHFTEDQDNSDKVAACISAVQNVKIEIRALQEQIADAKRRAGMDDGSASSNTSQTAKSESQAPKASEPQAEKETAEQPAPTSEKKAFTPTEMPSAEPITSVSDTDDAVEITVETVE